MFPEVPHLENEPLSKHTSYRIGGAARYFALPKTKEHIWKLGSYLLNSGDPYFILGNGSNVLAPDEGFEGVIICTKELATEIEFFGNGEVRAGASILNARFLRACAEKGLGGLEILSGVPGNIGGAVFMNAGTASQWIEESLVGVHIVSLMGSERFLTAEQLNFSYRKQHFLQPGELIISAKFRLQQEPEEVIVKRLAELIKKRKAAQPIEMPSCGSVFRNPEGKNAWRLIEQVGLKGFARGGARFSTKHSNFIVNEGGAKKSDVLFLIQLAKEKVYNEFGIQLHEEVVLLEPQKL